MVSLLLWELATSEVAVVHVSCEFLALASQISPKGFSESFQGHLWPIIKQVKEILIFWNRTVLPVYVLLWIFSAVIVETFFPGVIYKRCFDSGSMWVVCLSGSAHTALPTVAASFSLLSPPILRAAPGLSPSSLPPSSLPPTCWLVFQHRKNLLDLQLFGEGEHTVAAAAAAVIAANYMRIQIIWALVSERYSLSEM